MTKIDSDKRAELLAAELEAARAEIAELKRSAEKELIEREQAEDALRDGKQFYLDIFEKSPAPKLLLDPATGRIEAANLAACDLYGYSREELTAKRSWDIDLLGETESRKRLELSATTPQNEFVIQHRLASGAIRDVRVHSNSVKAGGRTLVHSLVIDVTERRRAETELREKEKNLRDAQHVARVGSWDRTLKTGEIAWSEELCRIYGVDPKLPVPRFDELARFYTPESWALLRAAVENTLKGGAPIDLDVQIVRADGKVIWATTRGEALRDAAGQVVGTRGTIQDVTERKRSEEALRESEGFLRETQRVANLGSYVMNTSTGSWRSSDVLDGIFGIGGTYERSVEGWANLIHPEDRAMMLDYFSNDVLGLGHAFDKEYRIVRHDNRVERWVHGLGTVQFDADGRPLSMHGTIQDISERKRAEEERAKLEAQLHQAQKMESVALLAGGVAHDFNNMLGVILGHVELAQEQVDPSQLLHEDLEEIRKAANRSADLTRQLLAFARKQTVAPKVLDLNDTVAAMLKLLERLIGEDIALRWVPGAGSCQVNMDPSQLDQILANLCVNARDAISGVGKLTIETGNVTLDEDYCAAHVGAVPGDYVRIAVSDDGCGMDKETQSHLFEPFFTTKAIGKGTGLGLATVYGIVKQNHGSIEVYSEPGHGTTFKIYLPRHLDAAEVPTGPLGPPVLRGDETILLVEDEAGILRMTRRMLEGLGYAVLTAGGPGDATRVANDNPGEIHLLMTDVVMPEMNGRDLAKNLLSRHPGMKVLFMSGYTADVIANHGVLDEGVNFIQKPFSKQDLSAKVREALDGG